jgi:hypothetical protein
MRPQEVGMIPGGTLVDSPGTNRLSVAEGVEELSLNNIMLYISHLS